MEDVLSKAAHELAARLEEEETTIVHVPADAIDFILNLFINPDCDWTDNGAFEAFQQWQEKCQELQAKWSQSQSRPSVDSIESLKNMASTVKQYLSVGEIKRCIDETTYEDIRVMSRDITILRGMWLLFSRLVECELPNDMYLPRDLILRFVLGMGRIVIYIDISLRKHGHGPEIDLLLPELSANVEAAFQKKFGNPSAIVGGGIAIDAETQRGIRAQSETRHVAGYAQP